MLWTVTFWTGASRLKTNWTRRQFGSRLFGLRDSLALEVSAPDILARDILAQDISAQDISAQDILAQDISAPDILAQDISAPDISATSRLYLFYYAL